ncbi:SEC-INDEPENDENT PROTEIN TRANSLOCASE PROTEIN TATA CHLOROPLASTIC [Salix koriyanagi]|uniref:SEC-INDEPENDENT PROTEIN TRANSLOCASE PROTEIN TATA CHLOROPLASTIC n=1 Tax=Salix koriyanagi TaxID=2511006 RepID=A0A9Q1A3Y8_9ROSI|nr:SEC-INDEPENDENT PROTEIN TRANSLOCASE PROTEIN TATA CHLOROPLASTIC [Salix koriyanagi]
MEISSITLSLPKTPRFLPVSSSNSIFFNSSAFFKKTKSLPELVVIAGVAALVFGPKKLPEVGKSIGKTVKSFQQFVDLMLDPK